ncbi:hypothetical protein SAMN05443247_05123 [Bradyrhizobium erythrophlei]|jgi:hypothetical protein|nr:hypothetical protein SAMN05443247_05123 [Bradyrhizobium erythrophlei]
MTGARSGHSPFRRVSVPDTGQYCAVFETYFLGRLVQVYAEFRVVYFGQ